MPNLTNSQEPEPVFLALGAGAGGAPIKIPGAGVAWEKNQEPEPQKISWLPSPGLNPYKIVLIDKKPFHNHICKL